MKIKDLRNLIKEELENIIVSDYINESIEHLDPEELMMAARKILKILSSPGRSIRGEDLKRYSILAQKVDDLDPILGRHLKAKIRDKKFNFSK